MPAPSSFDYAIVRVVPYVEREEFINVGVILFCKGQLFLKAHLELNTKRLTALAAGCSVAAVQQHLALISRICAGGSEAGPIGELDQAARFHWLVAPRSTVIQISPVHSGFCNDPEEALNDLFERLVQCS